MSVESIFRYFPSLTDVQKEQFCSLLPLYTFWNSQINVISRKDMENFYIHHVLHSLGIAKIFSFPVNARVLDAGTGGGFPGIPLAILFPGVNFTLVDSIAKKIKVAEAVRSELMLSNVTCIAGRVEQMKDQFDFITSRAVTNLPDFINLVKGRLNPASAGYKNKRILYLKGGEFKEELEIIGKESLLYPLSHYFSDPFFETKNVVVIKL